MRLSDIQPQYFPRLHYIARMLDSDAFVLRDDVQFVRNHKYPGGKRGFSYQAHTPIKAPDGTHHLAVSVKKPSSLPIRRTGVSYDQPWPRKHVNVLKSFYAASPNLRILMPEIEALLDRRFETLADLDIATLCWALGRVLGAPLRVPDELCLERVNELLAADRSVRLRRIELGSQRLGSSDSPAPSERIARLCELLGADEYLGGGTAIQAYLDLRPFRRSGIEVRAQSWSCPTYPQQHAARIGHVANLSILDLLMNAPADRVRPLLRGPSGE